MFRALFLIPILTAGLAAQVQLQLAPQAGPSIIVQLQNGDLLFIGTQNVTASVGLNASTQRQQIDLVAQGPAPFRNAPSPSLAPLGGSGKDVPEAAAVDFSGNIWIAGSTDSDDFNLVNPIVAQKVAYRVEGFVLELDPTGNQLLFATYLAGH